MASSPNTWLTGFTNVFHYLRINQYNPGITAELMKELQTLSSWPNPSPDEIVQAMDFVPDDDKYQQRRITYKPRRS
jgi:hypothetical protein